VLSPGGATRGNKGGIWQIFKNLLLENYKCQSFDISYEASLGHEASYHDPRVINGVMPRGQSLT